MFIVLRLPPENGKSIKKVKHLKYILNVSVWITETKLSIE